MTIVTSTHPTKKRIEIIDALRGFSLAGIVIVHMVENYVGAPTPEHVMDATRAGIADYIVDGFIAVFLRGKFFALFSFLFGLSFFIQMNNAEKQGNRFAGRFLWRLLILFGIGYLHHLFYRGDILTIYAVLGIFLIPFHRIGNKWILGTAALLFLGLGRYIVFMLTKGEGIFIPGLFSTNSPEVVDYFNSIKTGSLGEVFLSNATQGFLMKMDFQLGVFSRGYLTFAFFLIGLYAGRIRFFQEIVENKKAVKKVLLGSIIAFVISMGLTALLFSQLGQDVVFDNWMAIFGLTAFDLSNISMTFIVLSLFVVVYRKAKGAKWLNQFAPYGRMALSNYFFQSIIGTSLLFGWGLGYLGELRNIYTFFIAIGIIAVQMIFSKWWLKNFHYGPLEWLWRSITYFKRYPLKKDAKVLTKP